MAEKTGSMIVAAALLLALGVVAGSYLLSQADYSPEVNVSDITSTPNVYVSSNPPEHVITASATVYEKVAPDLLAIRLRVQTQDTDAKDSQERNAEVMSELRDELEGLGVPEDEIQSSGYRVEVVRESEYVCNKEGYNCHYEYEVVGYRTVHSLALSMTDLDKGGDVLDAATGVGVNETFVDSIDFTLQRDTREELEKELLEDASSAAKEKAGKIAAGLGETLGKAVSASESVYYPYSYGYRGYDMAMPMAEAGAPPTELSPGEMEVSATVNAGFEIG
ncbi:DUF541 domain-containing protein [Candidatus Micrarchaeota archaeon]|nr:DUF541 domain-containing protein [Candidatus Micrarchaeota archaeon]